MLGSAINISCPNTILNTIVAEEMTQFADELECYSEEELNDAIIRLIRKQSRSINASSSQEMVILLNGEKKPYQEVCLS